MDFDQWLSNVDGIVSAQMGLSIHDMRDRNWRDAFEDSLSPEEAVEQELGNMDDPESVMMEELFGWMGDEMDNTADEFIEVH